MRRISTLTTKAAVAMRQPGQRYLLSDRTFTSLRTCPAYPRSVLKPCSTARVFSTRRARRTKRQLAALNETSSLEDESLSQTTPSTKAQRLRRVAAQSVPNWLSTDPNWCNYTLQLLKVPMDDESAKATRQRKEYSRVYYESMPRFTKHVLRDPPPAMHAALDQLVDVGFSDVAMASAFRKTKSFHVNSAQWKSQLSARQEKLEQAQQLFDIATGELSALEKELEAMQNATAEAALEENDGDGEEKGLLQTALSAAQPLIKYPNNDEENDATNARDRKLKRQALERRIQSKKNQLRELNRALQSHEKRIAKLEAHHKASFQELMETDEYERINAVVSNALPDICGVLATFILERHSQMVEKYETLEDRTDLTRPHEWFSLARLDRRKIIFHGGPTNSGKTYEALERLKEVDRGIYLGPLRLLAAEVYEKLTMQGIYCNLYTGQERRVIPFATHAAATIEMASMTDEYDVVVIDEIQMIRDDERGFGWTKALLGTRCKEIHVCGGLESKDIVKKLVDACGDDFEFRTYERFTPLKVADRSLAGSLYEEGSYKDVQPGDCVVAFSQKDIFAIKREIETLTNYRCCVIYGSLPPYTRSEQARRFNDPDSGYDVLVASDAIGMGLNLNIRRIIFNSVFKSNGSSIVRLDHSAVKQISGRAGRRNSPFPQGEVTARNAEDLAYIRSCMGREIDPIEKAGLLPTASHIELFSHTVDRYGLDDYDGDLAEILEQFNELAKVKGNFFLCRQTPMILISKLLHKDPLSIRDKYTMCMSPVVLKSRKSVDVLKRFSTKLARGEVSGLTHSTVPREPRSFHELQRLCDIFNELELFFWLQKKFPLASNVMEEQACLARKEQTTKLIGQYLAKTDTLQLNHSYINRDLRLRREWEQDQDTAEEEMYDSDAGGLNAGLPDI